jgi:hypothetical protein
MRHGDGEVEDADPAVGGPLDRTHTAAMLVRSGPQGRRARSVVVMMDRGTSDSTVARRGTGFEQISPVKARGSKTYAPGVPADKTAKAPASR